MAASPIEICNRALSLLGSSERMNTLEDNTPDDKLWVGRLYAGSRRQVLSMHPWGFATRTAELAISTNTDGSAINHPVWCDVYDMPTDALRVLSVQCRGSMHPLPFEVEGGKVLADMSGLFAKFVFDNEDTTTYDPLFDEAFARYLASQAAVPAKLGMEVADSLLESFGAIMPVASRIDSTQGSASPPGYAREASWMRMRGDSGRYGYGSGARWRT